MRLLSLDFDPVYGGDDVARASFESDTSAFDYDIVIWDPDKTLERYTSHSDWYRGHPSLSDNISVRIQADALRRRNEFKEFLETGRTLVVIVRSPQKCYVATGEKTYSGTGRNRQTTQIVTPFDLQSALPVSDPQFCKARGDRIEIVGEGPIQSLLRTYKHLLRYAATMKNPPGLPMAKVAGTDRVVSSLLNLDNGGQLLLLPWVDLAADEADDQEDEGDGGWSSEAPEFQEALMTALRESSGGREISRPAWADSYETAEQKKLRGEVLKQMGRVEDARKKLALAQQKLDRVLSKDHLFLGTGRVLELEVKLVLEMLGGEVSEPEPGRDDWKVVFPEGTAVIEVKGVSKSAAEKHAAQLEKWVAIELENTGTQPKGILVVNTWRDVPLDQRAEEDFPTQMLPYCTSRGHCLLSGLQLFAIRHEIANDAGKTEAWRKRILETVGCLENVPDWHSVLVQTETIEESECNSS